MLYLQEKQHYSLPSATAFIALNSLSGMFGSVAYGFISDLMFQSRRPPATLVFGIIEILSLLVLFYGPHNAYVLTGALIVYGFTLSGILAALGGLMAVDVILQAGGGHGDGLHRLHLVPGRGHAEKLSGVFLKAHTVVGPDGLKHMDDWSGPIALWIGGSIASLVLAATLWKVRHRE